MKLDITDKLEFRDVSFRPKRTYLNSRADVNLVREFNFNHYKKNLSCVPIIAANMDTIGTIEMAKTLSKNKILTALHKFYSNDELTELYKNDSNYCFYTTGIRKDDLVKLDSFMDDKDDIKICMDVANGYTDNFGNEIRLMREKYPDSLIVAGNICTDEGVEYLYECGADIIKAGIAQGGVCLTKNKTGVSMPQLACVIECSKIAKELKNCYIMSDGGCKEPSDIAKAYGGGADFVMLGSMLSGYLENQGKIIHGEDGKIYYEFYGMSSKEAMMKYYNKVDGWRASEGDYKLILAKNVSVQEKIDDILGSLRSTCTYINCDNIDKVYNETNFILN